MGRCFANYLEELLGMNTAHPVLGGSLRVHEPIVDVVAQGLDLSDRPTTGPPFTQDLTPRRPMVSHARRRVYLVNKA